MKTCTKCKQTKPLASFSPKRSWCKACVCAAAVAWKRANPGRNQAAAKRWRERYPERVRAGRQKHRARDLATQRAWVAANRAHVRAKQQARRLKKYRITPAQFDALLASQGGGCAACRGPANGKGGTFHVDHDHETGIRRGLLCHSCNTALGLVNESPARLHQLIAYLVRCESVDGGRVIAGDY